MKKLTRSEIKEGLNTVPIDTIVLGANNPAGIKLTKKQKHFAEQVVATGNKSEAYRRAYNTKGKRETHARDAIKVAAHPSVSTYITALEAAKQAEEYLLPARLRALTIHKLSQLALSDEIAPAQQLKALELIGKMTEVALFSERREIVHSLDSNTLKAKLMEAVQLAISKSKSIRTSTKRTAQDLLAEITDVEAKASAPEADGEGFSDVAVATPTGVHPPESVSIGAGHLHSIPDNQSASIPIPDNQSPAIPADESDLTIPNGTVAKVMSDGVYISEDVYGGGVVKTDWVDGEVVMEKAPVTVWNEKGVGGI